MNDRQVLERRLYDAFAGFDIIDAHEHLPPEAEYLSHGYAGPNFFAGYVWQDLESAGMPQELKARLRDTDCWGEVKDWWPKIRPHWEMVRYGSYARAALLTAREWYGLDDINDDTIEALAEGVKKDNSPGLYQRVLGDWCKAKAVLTCQPYTHFESDPLLRPVVTFAPPPCGSPEELEKLRASSGSPVGSLDDLVAVSREVVKRLKREGAVGLKTVARERLASDAETAKAVLNQLNGGETPANPKPLDDFLFHEMLDEAAEQDLTVAVHAGIWGDFRRLDPKSLIPVAMAHPKTRFDLFHLGMPMARDAAVVGKNFPNVWLNLCWCHVISEKMTQRVLDEIIDLVPINKIIAFGADYRVVVQKAVGHLIMARENIAKVLAGRVLAGDFSEDRAVEIARMWFYENPARIYRLNS